MFCVHDIMAKLSRQRPFFHSEADFQHAFAWQVHSEMPDYEVRLEYRLNPGEPRYLDMWIKNIRLAIEFKYRTRDANLQHAGESFYLRRHDACDFGRYDFLKDVERLERLQQQGYAGSGLAILLTNEYRYWKENPPRRVKTRDSNFHIFDKRPLSGRLEWSTKDIATKVGNREHPINLRETYDLAWHDYGDEEKQPPGSGSHLPNARFRYLAVEVTSHPASK